MVTWAEFAAQAPELAGLGEARFRASGLAIVGTLRADGRPRITPVEPRFVDGELQLGMMWRSRKALDLLRDPRCTVHSTTVDKDGTEGDVKVYGTAEHVSDHGRRERHCQVTEQETGWRPEDEEFHVFSVDVEEVAFAVFGSAGSKIYSWVPGGDVRRLRPGPDRT
jgi:nitroimidazol reductase NimA-like FMN-containing flavoprotein (pyridoxamine 5'-phosphate oxidase superfamily)